MDMLEKLQFIRESNLHKELNPELYKDGGEPNENSNS